MKCKKQLKRFIDFDCVIEQDPRVEAQRIVQFNVTLAGVPGVARDDEWRNPIAFFP